MAPLLCSVPPAGPCHLPAQIRCSLVVLVVMGAAIPKRVLLPIYLMGGYLPNVGLATCPIGSSHTYLMGGLTTYLST